MRRVSIVTALALGSVLIACEQRTSTTAEPPSRPASAPVTSDSGRADADAGDQATKQRAVTVGGTDCAPRVDPRADDPEACHPSCRCHDGAWVCLSECGVRLSDLRKHSDVVIETTDAALQQELGALLERWRRDERLSVSAQVTTSQRQYQGLTWGLLPPKDQAALRASVEAFAKRHGKAKVRLNFRDPREFRLRLVIADGAVYRPPTAEDRDVKAEVRALLETYPQVERRLVRQSGEGDVELIYSVERLPAEQRQVLLRDLHALAKRAGKKALLVEYTE